MDQQPRRDRHRHRRRRSDRPRAGDVGLRFGTTIHRADFHIPADPRFVLNSFGVICFGLVGLELASVMGDEIQEPRKTLPGAVAWGGLLSGVLYIGATLTLLIAVSKNDISVLQGIVQAVAHMAHRVSVILDRGAFRVDAELLDRRNRFRVAGRFGAHSLRRRTRFLHAELARQGAPEVRHSVRGADRPRRRLDDSGRLQFFLGGAGVQETFRPCFPSPSCCNSCRSLHVRSAC